MKHKDKFATAGEAYNAWRSHCKTKKTCSECKYVRRGRRKTPEGCYWRWLFDEADEEPVKELDKLDKNYEK